MSILSSYTTVCEKGRDDIDILDSWVPTQFPFRNQSCPRFPFWTAGVWEDFPSPNPSIATSGPHTTQGTSWDEASYASPPKDRQDNPIPALLPCPVTFWSLRILVILFPQTFTFIKLCNHPNMINPPNPFTLLSGTHGLSSAKSPHILNLLFEHFFTSLLLMETSLIPKTQPPCSHLLWLLFLLPPLYQWVWRWGVVLLAPVGDF